MLRLLLWLADLWGSAWVFYFRYPSLKLRRFVPHGILLGPILQALLLAFFLCIYRWALPSSILELYEFFAIFSLAALTGFFHEDGWADVFDSLGVSYFDKSSQETIRAAMKDSRLGSFGVSGLLFLWLLRWFIAGKDQLGILGWTLAIFSSRAMVLGLVVGFRRLWVIGNGSKVSGALGEIGTGWGLLCLTCGVAALPLFALGLAAPVTSWLVCPLALVLIALVGIRFLVKRTGGFGGDMAGAAICFCEIGLLLFLTSVLPSMR